MAEAGSELVRITVNSAEAAAAVAEIRNRLERSGCRVPLIGDFHFNGHKLLTQYPDCAQALDKYRINPGNVGRGSRRDEQFATMIECACRYGKPVRIGVNWGSLDPDLLGRMMDDNARLPEPKDASAVMREALIVSALESAAKAEAIGLPGDRIVLSCKVSGVQDLITVYRDLAARSDLSAAPGPDRSGNGLEGHRRVGGGARGAAAGRNRRHHPGFPDSRSRRRSGARSNGRAGNPADHGPALLYTDGDRVPGMRAHLQHLLPGTGGQDPGVSAPADAGVARALSWASKRCA